MCLQTKGSDGKDMQHNGVKMTTSTVLQWQNLKVCDYFGDKSTDGRMIMS